MSDHDYAVACAETFERLDFQAHKYRPGDPPEWLCAAWLRSARELDEATRELPQRRWGTGVSYVTSLRAIAQELLADCRELTRKPYELYELRLWIPMSKEAHRLTDEVLRLPRDDLAAVQLAIRVAISLYADDAIRDVTLKVDDPKAAK